MLQTSVRNVLKHKDTPRYVIAAGAAVAVSSIPSTWDVPFLIANIILIGLLCSTIFLPVKNSLSIILVLGAAGQDIVSQGIDSTGFSTSSIWQLNIGFVRPSWIIFALLAIQLFKLFLLRKRIVAPDYFKVLLYWFLSVPVITSVLYGGLTSEYAYTEVIQDLKFPIMLLLSFVLYATAQRASQNFLHLIYLLLATLFFRHALDFIYVVSNLGPFVADGISRGSEDSAKGGVVLILLFGILGVIRGKGSATSTVIALVALILLSAYATRMLWISTFLGMLILILIWKIRYSLFLIGISVLTLVAAFYTLSFINPDSAEVALARAMMITEGRDIRAFAVEVDYNVISRIDPIRYAEIANILTTSIERANVLWGVGYGGYYEDNAVRFPSDLKSSFPEYSLQSGLYFTAHGYPTFVYLKYGLLGLILISAFWIYPAVRILRAYDKSRGFLDGSHHSRIFEIILFSTIAFIPTAMLQFYWSGKGLFLSGFLLAFLYVGMIKLEKYKSRYANFVQDI